MKCKYGLGIQDLETCGNIYIHYPGYYPHGKDGAVCSDVMSELCPNVTGIIKNCAHFDSNGNKVW